VIALIDYGAGNLRSVEFALERLGVSWRRAASPADVGGVEAVILPGVGAAESAMRELEARDLVSFLRETELPMLGICLGMQLFTERSDEGAAGVRCLGILPGTTRRIGAESPAFGLPLPHIGWNETELGNDPLFEGLEGREHFYFLHSYRVHTGAEHVVAAVDYGAPLPAAVRAGNRAAVQFHPEKSGRAGLTVLANFCRTRGPG